MFLEFILIVTSCLVTVEATKHGVGEWEQNPKKTNYDFSAWKKDIWVTYEVSGKNSVHTGKSLIRLKRMGDLEKTNQFPKDLRSIYDYNRSARIKEYLGASPEVVKITSLMRKTKCISHNLYDIILSHNGCWPEELSKIQNLSKLFPLKSRINMQLDDARFETMKLCWSYYKELLINTKNLIGRVEFESLIELSNIMNNKPLDEYKREVYNPISITLESISQGIAKYLIQIKHPNLDDIYTRDLIEITSIIEDLFVIEVQEPSKKLCQLLEPPSRRFYKLSSDIGIKITLYQRLIGFSCYIASIAPSTIASRILDNLLLASFDS